MDYITSDVSANSLHHRSLARLCIIVAVIVFNDMTIVAYGQDTSQLLIV